MRPMIKIGIGAAVICSISFSACFTFLQRQESWYLAALPRQIETAGTVLVSEKSDFVGAGCGAAVFHLSTATVKAIEERGLNFFGSARVGRGHPEPAESSSANSDYAAKQRMHSYNTYNSWKETPVPKEWTSEGVWSGLVCVDDHTGVIYQIGQMAKQPGSYYAASEKGELLVIPKLRLIVFSYFG